MQQKIVGKMNSETLVIKILKKLKAKENKLREALAAETSQEKRAKLQKELDIIHAQRKKGIKLLRED